MKDLVKINLNFPNKKSIKEVLAELYSPFSLSRYKRKSILYDTDFRYSSMFPEDMLIESDDYVTYIVTEADQNRLDLIARKFYSSPTLYWIIGYFNDIKDPFNVPVGTELKIPPISALYKSGGILA